MERGDHLILSDLTCRGELEGRVDLGNKYARNKDLLQKWL